MFSMPKPKELALMLLRILPGLSLAAMLYAQTDSPVPDYSGPSILSRGLLPSVTARNADIRFQPYFSVGAMCGTGLTGIVLDVHGNLPNASACGLTASAGVYGYHRWKHSTLSLRYSGDYQHYTRTTYY